MRSVLLAPVCALVLGVCAYLGNNPEAEPVKVRLRLVDAMTGKDVSGIVRVFPEGKDEPLRLPELFDRLRGLRQSETVRGWYVVPAKGAQVTWLWGRINFEAVSGLEASVAWQ